MLATESLLMGGWVLAVRREILRRIRKHSNLARFTHPLQQDRAVSLKSASWSQEAVPGPLVSLAPSPKKALKAVTESLMRRLEDDSIILIFCFLHFWLFKGKCLGEDRAC